MEADGDFIFPKRRNLRLKSRSRAVIFTGDFEDFTAVSMAATKVMKGPIREPRMTNKCELVVEVDNDADAAALTAMNCLAGVSVSAREAKPRVVSKGMVYGVHRSIPEPLILESLKSLGVTEVVRIKARDSRLGALTKTDRVLLTFKEDSNIPEQVCIGLSMHAVVAYHEPLQCFRCGMFGHVSKSCAQSTDVCHRCAQPGHLAKSCDAQERCINCQGQHSAKYGSCPARLAIIERWRRSIVSRCNQPKAVPVVAPIVSIMADESFRNGRSYAGVVKNGIKMPASM